MKTLEEIEAELKYAATREDLHKELHIQTRQFVTWLGMVTIIILGGVYFLLADIKSDIREIRNRLPALSK